LTASREMNHSLNGSGGLIETHFIKAMREKKRKRSLKHECEGIGVNHLWHHSTTFRTRSNS
jgi:hypothetical protein